MAYEVPKEILKKYADVLVKFALNSGEGVKKGECVLLQVHESSKPMLYELRKSVLEAGAHPIVQYIPDDFSRDLFEYASDEQLSFFPESYLKGKVDQFDHSIYMVAETNKQELKGIDPKKIMLRQKSMKPYMDWRTKKENEGKFTWTLGLYGTQAMADEAGLSLEEYWKQIIDACYLEEDDPIAKWKSVYSEMQRIIDYLNDLKIVDVRIEADNTDITVGLGEKRKWIGGRGRNIPSFEIFTSPDWREVNGHIQFTEKLYSYGNIIENVYLEFEKGEVVKATATNGENVLKEMIATPNANKVGELSLTDGRMSKITKFMAETLYDENVGGPQGNTHLAVGMSYHDTYNGDESKVSKEEWERMGFNESVVHTDIVATSKRKVTATLPDGSKKIIYENGEFLV